MGVLKQLKTALRNPKDTYLSWMLLVGSPGSAEVRCSQFEEQRTMMDFRDFEKMYQTWLKMKDTLEGSTASISVQVRALSREDGSIVASVGLGSPDEADLHHTELKTQGYIHERVAHLLKTWSEPFKALKQDRKRFEIRKDDRPMGFGIDDDLRLAQWDPDRGIYLGDVIFARVTYIARKEEWGLQPDYVVMALTLQEYLPRDNPKAQLWIGGEQPHVN